MLKRGRKALGGFRVGVAAVVWLGVQWGWAAELPPETIGKLGSEEFRERELAQEQLLDWARKQPDAAKDALFLSSLTVENPEVRERCLEVLRELVLDEYESEGSGYVGIRMRNELAKVPGDPELRGGIRVIEVVEGSAGDKAGLEIKDLIVGLNDEVWRQAGPSEMFSEQVKEMKPRTEIRLKVVRAGQLIEVKVLLGRRPAYVDQRALGFQRIDPAKAEKAEKDAFFRRWLDRRKMRE